MHKVALYDKLELSPVDAPGILLSCPDSGLPENEQNIAFRAAKLFLSRTGREQQGIRIILHKQIPTAAGLGGGSSDAAAVLKGLNLLFQANCSTEELAAIGVQLGADVPLFLYDAPAMWAAGIGEQLTAVEPLRGFKVLLVNPGIAVSTQWAYQTFSQTAERIRLTEEVTPFTLSNLSLRVKQSSSLGLLQKLYNDLEVVTAARYDVIRLLKERLQAAGASGTLMSGSGSTVFGLFSNKNTEQAKQCCQELKKEYEHTYLVELLQ